MATILKTDTPGKFKVRVSLGSDSAGTRRNRTKVIYGNTRNIKRLAAEWETEVRAEEAEGRPSAPEELEPEEDPASPTFSESFRSYIEVTAVTKRWSAAHRLSREVSLHEIELTPLGDIPMTELGRADLARHLATYAATPTRHGKERGPASLKQRTVILTAVVRFAMDDPAIGVRGNPARGLTMHDVERTVAERDIPTVLDFARHIEVAAEAMESKVAAWHDQSGHRGRPGYRHRTEMIRDLATFALLSGMRRGEISALRVHDVTHDADGTAQVLVRHSIEVLARGGWKLKRTKTGVHRTITVPPPAAEILLRRQVANETLAMADGVEPRAKGFVFSTGWGDEPLMPDTVTQWWDKLRSFDAHLEGLRFQDLRHAHASEAPRRRLPPSSCGRAPRSLH